ncbi:MAG: TrkH family potassium uptake protein [Clostridiales bacterium]|nr:TrkH family potassium uptake protein [Clostridiales bacterium]
MLLNYRLILKIIAVVLVIFGLSMIVPIIICIYYEESTIAFLIPSIVLIGSGSLILYTNKPRSFDLKIRDGFLIVALCWITASIFGSLPFMISGVIPNFIDAFFESSSGFTTTGATILSDVESLPKGILFWRSFTHWLGGMGILLLAIALLPSLGISGQRLVDAEASGPYIDKFTSKMSDSAKLLYFMYIGMTIAETVLLMMGGLSFFDSIIHTFGTVSTGGFSNYNNSIAHFNSTYVELVICFFMIMAGTNFNLYFIALGSKLKNIFRDGEYRAYLTLILVVTIIFTIQLLYFESENSFVESLRHSFFQTVSILTTTGFITKDFNIWPAASKSIIFILMFIGGCSSSASGSVKVVRVLVLLKLIIRGVYKRLHPTAVVPVKLNKKNIPSDSVSSITSFLFLYISLFLISTLIVCLDQVDLMTAASAAAACLGNIGPGFENVGPESCYGIFSTPIKLYLSFLMIAGRLEIFTLLLLLTPKFWNPDR